MSKHPVKIDKRAVRVADRDEIDGIERVPAANPFFSFRIRTQRFRRAATRPT